MNRIILYSLLIFSFFIYALTSVFTKYASVHSFLSWPYVLLLGGAVATLGIYAALWQQIIRRMPISDAFMWKGTTIVWAMLFASILFGEAISFRNVMGSTLIIIGITLYAWSERKEAHP